MSRDVMIGRQPIFDRDYRVVAYEILFRGSREADEHCMTSQVIVNTMLDLGIDAVAGTAPMFFNVDEAFLLNSEELGSALPADKVVLEILENVPATPEVLAACKRLKDQGYRLALDDVLTVEHAEAFIDYIDLIKLEWPDLQDRTDFMKRMRKYDVSFLAEKIDSYDDAIQASELNIDYFQGYFFCRPELVTGTKPPESKVSVLRAMQQALTATSIDDMFAVVKQDVSLSFRLLKYINSAAFGLRREVESIEQALTLLGLKNIRRWLTLLTMTSLSENKPREPMRQGLYRARFLESLARQLGEKEIDDDFMMGLFSILDALLDQPIERSLSEVSLAPHVHEGLTDPGSEMGQKLELVKALERGDQEPARRFTTEGQRITYSELNRLQAEAMHWADEQMATLSTL